MALDQRNTGFAIFQHNFNRLVIKHVFFTCTSTVRVQLVAFNGSTFKQALDIVGLAALLFEVFHDAVNLLIAYKRAVHPNRQTRSTGHVQHITHTQEGFCAHLIEDGSAVNFAAHLECNARRNIGFDQAGDDVHTGALRCQNQMDSCGAGLLRQTRNQFLDFFTNHHHQVGQLINHHHDMRQSLQWLRSLWRQAKRVVNKLS